AHDHREIIRTQLVPCRQARQGDRFGPGDARGSGHRPSRQVRMVVQDNRNHARTPPAGSVDSLFPAPGAHDAYVPTLSDLVARHTALDPADVEWMHSLVSDWQLLA